MIEKESYVEHKETKKLGVVIYVTKNRKTAHVLWSERKTSEPVKMNLLKEVEIETEADQGIIKE